MAKRHIVIDPITRIEGHLRIEVVVDESTNEIVDAYSSSTMFRGIETILKGRDPRDCGLISMRICGVCTVTHYQRSIEAVENAFGINSIPTNARLMRNMIQGALFMHDHIVHYYHLHSLDWVDVTSALQADPAKAFREVRRLADVAGSGAFIQDADTLISMKDTLQKFVDRGRLGIFSKGYWGNSGYKLTPEQNLIAMTHYFKALEIQRDLGQMMTIVGGKDPHPQSLVVGGVTAIVDLKDPARMQLFKDLAQKVKRFIDGAYMLDMHMLAGAYGDEMTSQVGAGLKNFLVYGGFPLEDGDIYQARKLFPGGIVYNGDLTKVIDFSQELVTEDATHAWYASPNNEHPFDGTTEKNYTGFREKKDNIAYLDTAGKYSWIKSPLYDDKRVEVGPLARMVVGYARKDRDIHNIVDRFLTKSGKKLEDLYSTTGRTIARALETQLISNVIDSWVDELNANIASGDLRSWKKFDFDSVGEDARGYGLEEAPRGALGHWVKIRNGKVENYQTVVPSTWNAAPRDYQGRMGAYEKSLVGIKLSNIHEPLEILRTVHSFDPCIACAVHVMDVQGKELGQYKITPSAC
ncbi:nickel-dependent hydrogenase large subunit [Thiolapillus sp.]